MSSSSRQKSWQRPRERVSVLAALAIKKETVSRQLTELREAHQLTQEKAAAHVGVTMRQWQRWESGESVPYSRNLDAIAEKFGISVATFFEADAKDGGPAASPDPFQQSPDLAAALGRVEAKLDAVLLVVERLAEALVDATRPVVEPDVVPAWVEALEQLPEAIRATLVERAGRPGVSDRREAA